MSYYLLVNNVKEGPYSFEELLGKNIKPNTLVWRQGFPNWKTAKDVKELYTVIYTSPPESKHSNHMPKTWLVESIIVTLCCCLPTGIIAIIYATKVENYYRHAMYEQAIKSSQKAQKWVYLSPLFWLIYVILITICYILYFTLIY